MLLTLTLGAFIMLALIGFTSSQSQPSVQLATERPSGPWGVCHLRLLGKGWAELAGVPSNSTGATVARLQSLGASRVTVASQGSTLAVVRFQAKRSVLFGLSAKFPACSKVA